MLKIMNKKRIFLVLLLLLLAFASIPASHLLKTYWNEVEVNEQIPDGYVDDASHLNLTKVNRIVDVATTTKEMQQQLVELLALAKQLHLPVAMAGAKHTMGGHSIAPDGIIINMRPYKQMQLDTSNNLLTVGAGALWQEVIEYLDQYDKSVAIMQAFSSFSIGGSLSANGHGWQKNMPPIAASVDSFTLMTANGEIVNCSRSENAELFHLAIGGYGLFGIMLDIKLHVVDNENLSFTRYKMPAEQYLEYFKQYATDKPDVKLVFGRLNISKKNFLKLATLNTFSSTNTKFKKHNDTHNDKSIEAKRLVFRSTVDSEYGKRLRWDLENSLGEFWVYTILCGKG